MIQEIKISYHDNGAVSWDPVRAIVRDGWALHRTIRASEMSEYGPHYVRNNHPERAGNYSVSHVASGMFVAQGLALPLAHRVLLTLAKHVPDIAISIDTRSTDIKADWLTWFRRLSRGEITEAPTGRVFL